MGLTQLEFIDIHYHANPDRFVRRYSALQAGEIYQQHGGAVVLKSHLGSTTEAAYTASSVGLPVIGSLALNDIGGGLTYKRVLSALANRSSNQFALIVDLPTITFTEHRPRLSREPACPLVASAAEEASSIINSNGKLKREVVDLLKLSLDYPVVISSGHASRQAVVELIEASDKLGVKRLLLNQPANPATNLTYNDLNQLSGYHFLWVEQTALTLLLDYQADDDASAVLKNLPRVIYSSDLGQTSQIDVGCWLKLSRRWFGEIGLTENKVREVCLENPIKLLT